jgi:hypothetical protein
MTVLFYLLGLSVWCVVWGYAGVVGWVSPIGAGAAVAVGVALFGGYLIGNEADAD